MTIDMENLKKQKRGYDNDEDLLEKKIAILSGSTVGVIKDALEVGLLQQGIRPDFFVGDYNMFFEDAVYGNKELEKFGPDIIYIHTSTYNVIYPPAPIDTPEDINKSLQDNLNRFEQAWAELKKRYNCPIIQNNFEHLPYRLMGNADSYHYNGRTRFIMKLNESFADSANQIDGLYINDISYLSSYMGLEKWYDLRLWYMYKYALSFEAIPVLCKSVSNIIKSLYGKNKKALVLDLDNTLWGGVIGDDGVDNIDLGEETPSGHAYYDFQNYLKGLSQLGVVLNIASKNEVKNVKLGLTHNSSALREDDFCSIKANWNDKSRSVEEISEEINLPMSSFVFIDDNPAERELIRGWHPEITVPEITTAETYIKEIDILGLFEVTNLSSDDLKRKEYYKSNKLREKAKEQYGTYEEYLKSLEMKSAITPFTHTKAGRITQLINKTNQFNLTTKRYNKEEIDEIIGKSGYITLCANLVDKFGDNGIVSAIIGQQKEDAVEVELWIMSCRVFKRDLEYAMFDEIIEYCKDRHVDKIRGIYKPTSKNGLTRDFYGALGFKKVSEDQYQSVWEYEIPEKYIKKNNVIGVLQND